MAAICATCISDLSRIQKSFTDSTKFLAFHFSHTSLTLRVRLDVRNDGDADDGAAKPTPASAPKPVTNNLGQLIGVNLNVTA
jgi:hypothetical protein